MHAPRLKKWTALIDHHCDTSDKRHHGVVTPGLKQSIILRITYYWDWHAT
jgi:hypothetical protein